MDGAVAADAVAQYGPRDSCDVAGGTALTMPVAGNRVTLQALHRLGKVLQLAIWCAMGVVAGGAAFDDRCMFEDVRTTNRLVAGRALLRNCTQRCLLGGMRIMAASAGGAAFLYRMARRQVELGQNVLVACCTQSRGFPAFELGGIQLLNFVGVRTVAVGTLDTSLVMLGKGEVGALLVGFVASQALLRFRQPCQNTLWLGRLCGGVFPSFLHLAVINRASVATDTVAMVGVGLGFGFVATNTLRRGWN